LLIPDSSCAYLLPVPLEFEPEFAPVVPEPLLPVPAEPVEPALPVLSEPEEEDDGPVEPMPVPLPLFEVVLEPMEDEPVVPALSPLLQPAVTSNAAAIIAYINLCSTMKSFLERSDDRAMLRVRNY
jgi:hypothetical protein